MSKALGSWNWILAVVPMAGRMMAPSSSPAARVRTGRVNSKLRALRSLVGMLLLIGTAAYGQISLPEPGYIDSVAGYGTAGYSGDNGLATAADLNGPHNIAVDLAGNIYIADTWNNRIRKVTASNGIITTVAGTGTAGYSGDGGAATSAELYYPSGVAVDAAGNIYITDNANNRIRKVTVSTGEISTVAGNGTEGYSGDGGPATSAELNSPYDVAVDTSGNIYISDEYNYRIRKVTISTGVISTVAGTGTAGYTGNNGPATSAEISTPMGLVLDGTGNIYFVDWGNVVIRKITASSGDISTVAGNGSEGYSGDGGPATSAQLYYPESVAVDATGNIYIADVVNNRIRKVTASTGDISTVAGNGTAGYSGDGGVAISAELEYPYGVAVDTANYIYIADNGNNRIRAVGQAKATPSISVSCSPNPIIYGSETTSCTTTVSGGATGTITWTINGGAWTTTSLSGGATSLSGQFAGSGAGTYTIGAAYSGDTNNNAVSASTTLTINKTTPTVSVFCSPNPITFGGANSICTISASDSGTLTGTVSLTYNGTAWATLSLSSGSTTATWSSTFGIGTYTIGATYNGDSNNFTATGSGTVSVNQATQTITFTAPSSPVTYGVSPIALSASSTSGLSVTFSVISGPGSISGSTLTITGAGTVVVAANQTGNANYAAASQVTQSVVVNQASQIISFTAPASPVIYGVAPIALSAAGGASGNTVVFSIVSGPGSISGSTLTITGAGTVVVAANQAGNANYAAAVQVTQSVVVNQASQTISFNAPASPVTYGVAPIVLSATGGASGNAVVFSVVSGLGTISGSTLTITGVGTVVVAANQAGNANYSAAAQVTQSIVVNKAPQTINFTAPASPVTYGVAPIALSATGGASGNTVVISIVSGPGTISGSTLTITGAGTVVVAANQAGNANYSAAAQVTQSIVIQSASQTITFTAPSSPVTYGFSPIALSATASSGLAVTFSMVSGPGSVSGSTLTITGTGTVVVAANQAGNANYLAASQVTHSIVVNLATPTLSVATSGTPSTYGGAVTFTATISNGPTGTVTFYDGGSSIGAGTISGTTATFTTSALAGGSHAITAGWAGNSDYNAVTSSAITQAVNAASQTITFTAPSSPVTFGVSPISLSASASSGLGVTFSVVSGPGMVSGSTLTITGAGMVVVAVNQAGNANYAAAVQVTQSVVVSQASQTITFTAPSSPVTFGVAPISLSATGGASGNAVVFSIVSGPGSISGSTLTITGVGTVVIAANQAGSANYAAASQISQSIIVNQASSTISVASSSNPSMYSMLLTFTATLVGGASGNVSFYDGGTALGTGVISGTTATFSTAALLAGPHSITASWAGNSNFTGATSNAITQIVNKESVVINSASSLSPSVYGDNVAWTFTLTGSGIIPTGTITIKDGANTLATVPLNAGIATYNTSALVAGSHTLTAVYNGDNNYQ